MQAVGSISQDMDDELKEELSSESKKKAQKARNPDEWRPFSTSTSRCNCGKFDLENLPQLQVMYCHCLICSALIH